MRSSKWPLAAAALCLLVLGASSRAQQQQQAQPPPQVGYVYPAGGRQGATFEVMVGGQFLDGASNIYFTGAGVRATVLEVVKPITQQQITFGSNLEAAEILEHFQWSEEAKDKDALASELADVTLYLLQLASVSGIDLEQAVLKKLEVNAKREWTDR